MSLVISERLRALWRPTTKVLRASWLALLLSPTAHAQSSPEAVKCAEEFMHRMSSLKGYSADMNKAELFDGRWHEEPIGLYSEGPNYIRYTFLKEGSSGVKNNGMQLLYQGVPELAITWGESHGLGVFTNRAARAVTGKTIGLTDSQALKGELFTLNRAGYHHIYKALQYHLKALKSAKTGGLKGGSECHLHHSSPEDVYTQVHLKTDDSITDLEDRYATYGFFIRSVNRDLFRDLAELFHRKKEFDIRVPEFLPDFDVDLDPSTHLPTHFRIYLNGEKAGDYTFTNIKSW